MHWLMGVLCYLAHPCAEPGCASHFDVQVGRWGEALVHCYLSKHPDIFSGHWQVEWVNQELERGLPFDLVLTSRHPEGSATPFDLNLRIASIDLGLGQPMALPRLPPGMQLFVEVKSTRRVDKRFFEMSKAELDFADGQGDGYHVVRVAGVGTAQPQLSRVVNPTLLWRLGHVKVAMVF
jgi:hypothetical protein